MFLQAKRNLTERLSCFGLSERFDESLALAKLRLDLRRVIYRSSDRVNPSRPRGDAIPADMRRTAEAANRYDIALYRHAQELFNLLPERGQPDFELELAALRAARADGELALDAPPPDGLEIEHVWRLALEARAELLRLEHERATGADRRRLTAAEVRTAALERALEQTVARLEVARAKRARLARRVERLRAEP
jgi:hypothetical protein